MEAGLISGKADIAAVVKDLEKTIPKDKILVAMVDTGSRMWGMHTPKSDHDVLMIYAEPTVEILSGRITRPSLPNKHGLLVSGRKYDVSYVEIGVLISRIKRGEITSLWSVLSPVVYSWTAAYCELRSILKDTHIKGFIPSLIGMARSNLMDVEKRKSVRIPQKSINTAYRNALFGAIALEQRRYDFQHEIGKPNEVDVMAALDSLQELYYLSNLPELYDALQLENFLLTFRKSFL